LHSRGQGFDSLILHEEDRSLPKGEEKEKKKDKKLKKSDCHTIKTGKTFKKKIDILKSLKFIPSYREKFKVEKNLEHGTCKLRKIRLVPEKGVRFLGYLHKGIFPVTPPWRGRGRLRF
jgi:hypothetical protein